MNNAILTPAIIEMLLVTARGVVAKSAASNPVAHLPLPSEYLDVLVVFGALSLIPDKYGKFSSMVAWGFVVATGLNMTGAFNSIAAKAAAQKSSASTTSPGATNE